MMIKRVMLLCLAVLMAISTAACGIQAEGAVKATVGDAGEWLNHQASYQLAAVIDNASYRRVVALTDTDGSYGVASVADSSEYSSDAYLESIGADFSYPTNVNGQTYGTWGNRDQEAAAAGGFPDLIPWWTDDFSFGYVYRADYEAAWYRHPTYESYRTETVEAIYQTDLANKAQAFCDYYQRLVGTQVDYQTVLALFSEIDASTGQSAPWFLLTNDQQQALTDLFPAAFQTRTIIKNGYEAALRDNDFVVTVYDLDGLTVLGVSNIISESHIRYDSYTSSSNACAEYTYLTNDQGQTYGTFGNLQSEAELAGELPELIPAWASNGFCGYLLRADYQADPNNYSIRTAAAMDRYQQDFIDTVDAFCSYYQRTTGVPADHQAVETVFLNIDVNTGRSAPWFMLSKQQQTDLLRLFPEQYRVRSVAKNGYEEALRANDYRLTVYDLDGETVLGEVYCRY